MSIELFDVVPSLTRQGCHEHVISEAIRSNRQVAKIVWDEPDTPEHCLGYIQWSVRPFLVTDRCDGTRDRNVMLVCLDICKATGVDMEATYQRAYADERPGVFLTDEYLAYVEEIRSQTVIPSVSEDAILNLLNSLYSMNYRSFVEELCKEWEARGFKTDNYWEFDQARGNGE